MNNLSTSYQDAVFSGSRKYTMTQNSDNTVSFTDATDYTTPGTRFGAADINATNGAINSMIAEKSVNITTGQWTASGSVFYKDFNVNGMLASDTPVISLYIASNTAKANAKTAQKMFSYITNIETMAGKIRVYSHTAPTSAYTILIKGV